MIELGGNITLDGFAGRDYAELIVVKKIVGRYARELSDGYRHFQLLDVKLDRAEPGAYGVTASCVIGERRLEEQATAQNLFMALDSALKAVVRSA